MVHVSSRNIFQWGHLSIFFLNWSWHSKCVGATACIFDTRTDVLMKVWTFLDRKYLYLKGTRPPAFGFMPSALTFWAFRARHLLSHVLLNDGSCGVDILNIVLSLEKGFVKNMKGDSISMWKERSESGLVCVTNRHISLNKHPDKKPSLI